MTDDLEAKVIENLHSLLANHYNGLPLGNIPKFYKRAYKTPLCFPIGRYTELLTLLQEDKHFYWRSDCWRAVVDGGATSVQQERVAPTGKSHHEGDSPLATGTSMVPVLDQKPPPPSPPPLRQQQRRLSNELLVSVPFAHESALPKSQLPPPSSLSPVPEHQRYSPVDCSPPRQRSPPLRSSVPQPQPSVSAPTRNATASQCEQNLMPQKLLTDDLPYDERGELPIEGRLLVIHSAMDDFALRHQDDKEAYARLERRMDKFYATMEAPAFLADQLALGALLAVHIDDHWLRARIEDEARLPHGGLALLLYLVDWHERRVVDFRNAVDQCMIQPLNARFSQGEFGASFVLPCRLVGQDQRNALAGGIRDALNRLCGLVEDRDARVALIEPCQSYDRTFVEAVELQVRSRSGARPVAFP